MSTESELSDLLLNTKPMIIPHDFKGVLFSDLHMEVKDPADDFCKNEVLFNLTFDRYVRQGYKAFFLGDVLDLWKVENADEIVAMYPSTYTRIKAWPRIKGNHDGELPLPEAIVLQYEGSLKQILLVHGFQGDFFNDDGYPLGKFFVRNIWRNLEMTGFLHDPTTATMRNPKKHEAVKAKIKEWAFDNQQIIIFGHTHAPEEIQPYYFNCGSWVGNGGQCVEINGHEISVKFFT
jgi:UDP-2,3-diacylglucosamine pyrophosphatase LpxH